MKEAKLRMEDALAATKSSCRGRYHRRRRICLYPCNQRRLQKLVDTLEGDEKTGAKIILKALEAPLFHIAANAGLEGAVIVNKVRESASWESALMHYNEEYVNMVEAGILDPAKVTRSALQNATSVASTLPDHREL